MTDEEVNRDRVAQAARVLDNLRPGWFREINFETLDMLDINSCIIGQLTNGQGYNDGNLREQVHVINPTTGEKDELLGAFGGGMEDWRNEVNKRLAT